jgi:hypothetical protein
LQYIARIFLPSPVVRSKLLSTNEIFAAPKQNDDVRPIGIGFTLRKLAAKVCLWATQGGFNDAHFGDLQYAMRLNGMEEIIHLFGTEMERRRDWDLFNADGDSAFNLRNCLPYDQAMYLHCSETWYYGLPDNIKSIVCKNGYHQGDVPVWLYVVTILSLLLRIRDHAKKGSVSIELTY